MYWAKCFELISLCHPPLGGSKKKNIFEFELAHKLNPFIYNKIFVAIGCQIRLPPDTLFQTQKYKGFSKMYKGKLLFMQF